MNKKQLDEAINLMVKKQLAKKQLKEEDAYERNSDRNLKKKLMDISELNQIYVKLIDKKEFTTDMFTNLMTQYSNALRDFKLHSKNWNK